ncbi:CbtA family protein [Rhizobium sp. BE258]|uniref:CbtA family protein n=1 Tax=Rhizobium sp. BE258 TaxID=2817722 RepID=UPI000DDBC3C4|nr:CbtA family protein [Rhizobium sp. BE258]MDR7145053.1 cobalt transporter subunit CbtA [Rhizobium sp. BE258]
MPLFRSIVFASVLVGLIVGTATTAVQFFGTIQLIAQAEVYERAGSEHHHDADSVAEPTTAHSHQHEEAAWEPSDGVERLSFTLVANILTSIGYALVLIGLVALRGKRVTWREGIFWGLAAFASVMLAPMLGLPPELPGTPSAPLDARQLWWVGTAVATAAGIALIAFNRTAWAAVLATIMIALPHLIGAPVAPEGEHGLAPAALEQQFIAAAVITSFLFWVMLGSLGAAVYGRFGVEK